MGGMRVALESIRHPEEGIRRRICDVIASCLQNEPTVQAGVLQLAGLPVLLERVKEDESPAVRTQAFSAVSGAQPLSEQGRRPLPAAATP